MMKIELFGRHGKKADTKRRRPGKRGQKRIQRGGKRNKTALTCQTPFPKEKKFVKKGRLLAARMLWLGERDEWDAQARIAAGEKKGAN